MSFWSCRKFIPQFYRRLTHTLNLVVQVFVCPSLERHVSDNRYVEALIPNPKSFPPYSTLKCLFICQDSLSATSPPTFQSEKKIIHCHCHSLSSFPPWPMSPTRTHWRQRRLPKSNTQYTSQSIHCYNLLLCVPSHYPPRGGQRPRQSSLNLSDSPSLRGPTLSPQRRTHPPFVSA